MEIFLNNFNFIWFNSFLALVAVLFGWLMSKASSTFAKILTGFIWLLFLPNTIYILTDMSHLFEQLPKANTLFKFILIIQYSLFSIFGILSFVISIYFFQKLLERKRKKGIKLSTIIAIIVLNFLVGFAVILGGIERTNSWYIFTNPSRVLEDILNFIYSQDLLILSIGTGVVANLTYFLMVESIATWGKKLFKN